MGNILVTGLTGNVGYEVAESLKRSGAKFVCAVRSVEKARRIFGEQYAYTSFDFTDPTTFDSALQGIDRIFLNYPPGMPFSDFHAFIRRAKERKVRHITYLSVKGAQLMPFVPHYKNEKELACSGISYTFLRAGYFTQNLNMFLLDELVNNDRIYVPAGRGKTSFIDLRDIGDAAAVSLLEPEKHHNRKYVLTGGEALDFYEVAEIMTRVLGRRITYAEPRVKEFKAYMLGKGLNPQLVNLVAGLHILTMLGQAKGIKQDIVRLLKRPPISVEQYVNDNQDVFNQTKKA
jgi:uncharacterized protein YbjT (DUF2867 family)